MNKQKVKNLLAEIGQELNDEAVESLDRRLETISAVVSLFPENGEGSAVLDVGTRDGFRLLPLALMNYRTFGICLTEDAIGDDAAYRWEKYGILVERSGRDSIAFPYPNDYFDWVICDECESLSAQESTAALSEIKRVLRPKGKLILQAPNTKSVRDKATRRVRISEVVESIAPDSITDRGSRSDNTGIPLLSEMVDRYGFNVLLRVYTDRGSTGGQSVREGMGRFISRFVPRLRDTVVMVCEMK